MKLRTYLLGCQDANTAAGNSRFIAFRRFATGIGLRRSNAATCASAWTPASVLPEARHTNGFPLYLGDYLLDALLDRGQARLHLPSVEVRPVVGESNADPAHLRLGGWSRAGLLDRHAVAAKRTILGSVRNRLQGRERYTLYSDVHSPAAPVDDRTGRSYIDAARAKEVDYLSGAAAGRDDILDDNGHLVLAERESTPQAHSGLRITFGEQESSTERARHLVPDDDAAQGRRNNHSRFQSRYRRANSRRQFPPQPFGNRWVLEYQCTLQIFGAVETAGEPEVPAKICAGLLKQVESARRNVVHCRSIYHRPSRPLVRPRLKPSHFRTYSDAIELP